MRLRENFITRVFAYYRWSQFVAMQPTAQGLVRFHTQHKLTLLAHSRPHYQALGRLVARAGKLPMPELLHAYGTMFMDGLKVKATTRKYANVLYHLLGYLKKALDADDKAEGSIIRRSLSAGIRPPGGPAHIVEALFQAPPTTLGA
jgi:uncharacterized protein YbgA (DUF1722 family)